MASPHTLADRRFEFDSKACPQDTFAVVRMSGFEALSRLYRFELILVSDDARLDLAKVLRADAMLRILAPNDAMRATPYAGMLAEFDQLHQAGGFTFYRAVLVPRLWRLSMYRNSEVYLHEQTVVDIVESILKGAKLKPGGDYLLKLSGTYRPRSYVCQYQETPFAFISRWLEREGIYFAFEQVDGRDRLVLLDSKVAQPAEAVAVNYRPADELDTGLAPDSVQGFVCRTRPLPRRVVLQDFNHRRASVPLVAQAEVSADGSGEEMLYGENFRSEEEGQRYARIRAQELLCGERVFSGEGTAVGLRSGYFMDLSHHYREDFNGRYLVTEVRHEGSQAAALLAGLKTPFNDGEQGTRYSASFVALPAQTQFRPARSSPKPRVAGTMSATIDAEGSGEYAELDAYGQYRVQIPFDRTDKQAAKGSAPMRMATPYAGSDHGMHFPLHKGTEVLLSFTDGDPDQPVILAAVPNSTGRSVVDERNPHLNLISTKGGNQVAMTDTKGKEVIWLNSPFHSSSIGIGSVHPEGDGSIYTATKGGSDSVSFGTSNSMSFGATNKLALGTTSSISAAFDTSFDWGTSIGIKAANSVEWKMNSLPKVKGVFPLKNLSIDDSTSITLKRSFEAASIDTTTIEAGALDASGSKERLEFKLKIVRGLISAYAAVNFAKSTVFGMAVNASDGGALLSNKLAKDKKALEEDEEFKKKAVTDKAAEKTANAKATPPKGMVDPEAIRKWHAEKDAATDAKFAAQAEERAKEILSPQRGGLQGWPGIVNHFGLNALSNVAALAALQGYVRHLMTEIEALELVSKIELGTTGITQVVNGNDAPNTNNLLPLRAEFTLDPNNGATLEVGAKRGWRNAGTRYTKGTINLKSKTIALQAADVVSIGAPSASFSDGGALALSIGNDKAVLQAAGGSVIADSTTLKLISRSIEIGYRQIAGAVTAAEAAVDVLTKAQAVLESNDERARQALILARSQILDAPSDPNQPVIDPHAALNLDCQLALKARQDGQRDLDEAIAKHTQAITDFTTAALLNGINISDTEAALKFGPGGWRASNDGLSVNFGTTNLAFTAASASLDGAVIKLG